MYPLILCLCLNYNIPLFRLWRKQLNTKYVRLSIVCTITCSNPTQRFYAHWSSHVYTCLVDSYCLCHGRLQLNWISIFRTNYNLLNPLCLFVEVLTKQLSTFYYYVFKDAMSIFLDSLITGDTVIVCVCKVQLTKEISKINNAKTKHNQSILMQTHTIFELGSSSI